MQLVNYIFIRKLKI